MNRPIYLLLIAFLLGFPRLAAGNAEADFDSLSRIPSEKLMEEGRRYFEDRQAGKALSRFMVVAERYREDGSRSQRELSIRALNNVGCVYKFFYFDYPRAYEYLSRSYELAEETGYESFMPVIMVNLGDLLSDYGLTYHSESLIGEARSLFKDCFTKAFREGNWELMTTSFFNLSNLNYDINLKDYDAIFSPKIPSDTPDLEFVRLQYRGIQLMQQGRYADARDAFERQIGNISTPWEASRDTISSLINIAQTYRLEHEYTKAADVLKEAMAISDKAGIIDLSASIAGRLADCYSHTGDTLEKERYRALYLEKREELDDARLSNIGELKYISDLRKEEAKAQEIAVRNRIFRYMIIALVAVLLTIAVSAAAILRSNRRLKLRNRSLFDSYQKLLDAEQRRTEDKDKYTHSNLNDSKREKLLERIQEVMEDPEAICRLDFSSKQLAEMVGSNTTYVSQAINEKYGVSFSTLLGNSRVRLVCRRATESNQYDNLTIEGIANSVGFKSRTAFLNAFKREVGLTPSEYMKMAGARRNSHNS